MGPLTRTFSPMPRFPGIKVGIGVPFREQCCCAGDSPECKSRCSCSATWFVGPEIGTIFITASTPTGLYNRPVRPCHVRRITVHGEARGCVETTGHRSGSVSEPHGSEQVEVVAAELESPPTALSRGTGSNNSPRSYGIHQLSAEMQS